MSADDARIRFARATEAHLTLPLDEGIEIQHVDPVAWRAAADPIWRSSQHGPLVNPGALVPAEQQALTADLNDALGPPLEHRLLFVTGGEVIGAFWGTQEPYGRYYMVSTVFRADWQRRGLYSRLLPRIVAAVEAAGFAEVWSRHRADNNMVLVPKLRAGFMIAGFDISLRWGILVHLRRYLRDSLTKIHRYRVDGTGADELRAAGLELP